MNINLAPRPQVGCNIPRTLQGHEELSPIGKKNIFSKNKKTLSPSNENFNPHLERLNINYYMKQKQIMPYSYTVTKNCTENKVSQSEAKIYMNVNRSSVIGSNIKSLKDCSCIETVSEKNGKQNQSDTYSELEVSRSYKQKQISSQISSPMDFKNFNSTFTLANNTNRNQSEHIMMKSYQLQKLGRKSSQVDSVSIKMNKVKLINFQSQNDKKTNKQNFNRKYKNSQNFSIQKSVFDLKIKSYKKSDSSSKKNKDIEQSNIIFDYSKYSKNQCFQTSLIDNSKSIFHPINDKIFRFFHEDKKYEKIFKISNLNETFIDIVKEINSPKNGHAFIFQSRLQKSMNRFQNEQNRCSEYKNLTSIEQEGPRSFSLGKDLRRLSGEKNKHVSSLKREPLNQKSQTRPTTARTEFWNHLELNTPKQSTPYQDLHSQQKVNVSGLSIANFIKEKNNQSENEDGNQRQFIRNLFTNNRPVVSPSKNAKKLTIVSQQQIPQQNFSIQRTSNSKDSRSRMRGKGISVSSKEKKSQSFQSYITDPPIKNGLSTTTKLKSLQQIKNMKKLRLSSPQRNQSIKEESHNQIRFVKRQ